LCFIGKVKLPDFLQQQLQPKDGKLIEVFDEALEKELVSANTTNSLNDITTPFQFESYKNQVIGRHQGAHFYTIGQRKGLGIGGRTEPLFVLEKDTDKNILYVGQGENHKGLYRKGLRINSTDINWIRTDLALKVGQSEKYDVRFRYRQKLFDATLYVEPSTSFIVFDEPQKGIAPGQFVAWYKNEELIGSCVIKE